MNEHYHFIYCINMGIFRIGSVEFKNSIATLSSNGSEMQYLKALFDADYPNHETVFKSPFVVQKKSDNRFKLFTCITFYF